jgi:hypothetical protein
LYVLNFKYYTDAGEEGEETEGTPKAKRAKKEKAEPVTERAILPRPITTTTANSFKVVSWNVDGTTNNYGVTVLLQLWNNTLIVVLQ